MVYSGMQEEAELFSVSGTNYALYYYKTLKLLFVNMHQDHLFSALLYGIWWLVLCYVAGKGGVYWSVNSK
jgi:hypothetical protein